VGAKNGYVVKVGYRLRGDDDNRFQSEAIYKSGAVILIHPTLGIAGSCTTKGGQIYGKRESAWLYGFSCSSVEILEKYLINTSVKIDRYHGYHLSKKDLPTLSAWIKLNEISINPEPKPRRQVMEQKIKNVGLDVHKNSISIGIADDGRDGEVRCYGNHDIYRYKPQMNWLGSNYPLYK
jgi:hypothetical protein